MQQMLLASIIIISRSRGRGSVGRLGFFGRNAWVIVREGVFALQRLACGLL
jgi:hypothetical protein